MTSESFQKEMDELEFQIDYQEKRLDLALKNDLNLGESKRLLHELRLLRQRLSRMKDQNPDDEQN